VAIFVFGGIEMSTILIKQAEIITMNDGGEQFIGDILIEGDSSNRKSTRSKG